MFDKLSDRQKEILDKDGYFVVRACPGSGKTYSVSAKLANLIPNWEEKNSGVAVLSFTNTAWKEIQNKAQDEFACEINYPHYVGTIDSFVNQNIFLPYGHKVMGCETRPELVGEPYGIWTAGSGENDPVTYFDKCSFKMDGSLNGNTGVKYFQKNVFPPAKNKDGSDNKNHIKLLKMKTALAKKGYATQTDANYYALQILKKYPIVAKTLASKYSWLVIDEAQDTTEIHMAMVDILISSGVKNVMLVGDPDQAIYEWNDAMPSLFLEKEAAWSANSVIFDQNFRSSQKICDAFSSISTMEKIEAANEKVKDLDPYPEVWKYDPANRRATLNSFLDKCDELGIEKNEKNVAVLFRSKNFFGGGVPFGETPWVIDAPYTRDLVASAFFFSRRALPLAFKRMDRAYVKAYSGSAYCSKKDIDDYKESFGKQNYNKEVVKILKLLPKVDQATKLGDWVNETNDIFKKNGCNFKLEINEKFGVNTIYSIFVQERLENPKTNYKPSTIHGVKGETFEAVILFLKSKVHKTYKYMLENKQLYEEEELRNVYVALSRPSHLLIVAVPTEKDKELWEEHLNL